jgi:hypothetical protein
MLKNVDIYKLMSSIKFFSRSTLRIVIFYFRIKNLKKRKTAKQKFCMKSRTNNGGRRYHLKRRKSTFPIVY